MFTLLLLVSKMGMLVALLNTTDQTVTVSKNRTEEVYNMTDTLCGEQCNVRCHLQKQNVLLLPTCVPRTVQDLDLSFNNISIVRDQDVVDLSNLRFLSLSHNLIKEIQWEIHILAELESLDLSHNLLTSVPKCLMLKKLRKLSLAHNPILHLQPLAFSCFPNLVSLNLSLTFLGKDSSKDIAESAFALNATQAQEDSLKSLHVLDLSATYIATVNRSWSKDLSNLKELHLRNMIRMEVLEDDLITWIPGLQALNCADSTRLHYIGTEIFENATNLTYLDFQNCNFRDLPPWNISSKSLTIDLRGNPLVCDCKLDWLLSNHMNLTLISANETFCTPLKGDVSSISLLRLHEQCKLGQHETTDEILDSVSPSTEVMDIVPGTSEDSLSSTVTPQAIGQKYMASESATDLTTILENESSVFYTVTQSGMVTPETSSTTEVDMTPKDLTLSMTEEPITEHKFPETGSSNGDQSEIPRDYPEEYDEGETQPSATTSKNIICDYEACRHLQTPCSELQLLSPCFCPGLSGDDTIPDPPHLQGVMEITDTSAQILWCAPNSVVEKYQLVYHSDGGANESVDNIYVTIRQYTLYNLTPFTDYKVCVLAFNKKGHSVPINGASRTPCAEFRTRPSYILILSILSGLGGLFLVTIAVLSTCLYKACKNSSVGKYDTHLVSYKNPAFEYQCTIPSYH